MLALFAFSLLLLQQSQPPLTDKPAPSAVQPADMIYPFTQVDVRPRVLSQVDAEFPEKARKKKMSGSVELEVRIGKDGIPASVRVVKGIGYGFDEKAREALMQYRFTPGMKNGVPVRTYCMIEVSFYIH